MVAMAIVEVTAKRIPIKITFVANGSCILKKTCLSVIPTPIADSDRVTILNALSNKCLGIT